jgi:hypothetical protein
MRKRVRLGRSRRAGDAGMATAEYAIGLVAAAAFAGILFKIVTSHEVRQLMLGMIHRALSVAG